MKNSTIKKTRYKNYESQISALGLMPGEDYGRAEECSSCITQHKIKDWEFEVYYDEMASPWSQWKAFCMGIGTISGMERSDVIARMRAACLKKKLSGAVFQSN